jgi:hypothetical protein
MSRRFPPPWTVHAMPAGFRVADANGCWLAYCYGDDAGFKTSKNPTLSVAVARAIAELVAALPGIMQGEAEGHTKTWRFSYRTQERMTATVRSHPLFGSEEDIRCPCSPSRSFILKSATVS